MAGTRPPVGQNGSQSAGPLVEVTVGTDVVAIDQRRVFTAMTGVRGHPALVSDLILARHRRATLPMIAPGAAGARPGEVFGKRRSGNQ